MKKRKRKYLVFLGAGSSIPLGFPGSVQLVKDFVTGLRRLNAVDKETMLEKIKKLKRSIVTNKFDYDSESLYSCLEGYSSPAQYAEQMGPFACSLCKIQPVSKVRSDPISIMLRSLFEEFLITRYYKEDPFLKLNIKSMYNRFFSKISGIKDWKSSEPDWESSTFDIFTTNFDYVLETYSDQVNKSLFKGYRIVENDRIIFTPKEYDKTLAPLRLYKLHGSVELSLLADSNVVAHLPPGIPGTSYKGEKISSKVMIYGIQKNIIAEPYFDLLSIFKKRLSKSKNCFVVGYSFRDPWITQIFIDVLKSAPRKIKFIGEKESTKIPKIPLLDKAIIPASRTLEEFLELELSDKGV